MKKKGQAFLITAVIILMLLVAFITITNYSKKSSFSTVQALGEEIQIESEFIMDNELINRPLSVADPFTTFRTQLSNRLDSNTIIYVIQGGGYSPGDLDCYKITKVNPNSQSCTNVNTQNYPTQEEANLYWYGTLPSSLELYVNEGDELLYKFPDWSGEGETIFYFVIIQTKGEERHVYTNGY